MYIVSIVYKAVNVLYKFVYIMYKYLDIAPVIATKQHSLSASMCLYVFIVYKYVSFVYKFVSIAIKTWTLLYYF